MNENKLKLLNGKTIKLENDVRSALQVSKNKTHRWQGESGSGVNKYCAKLIQLSDPFKEESFLIATLLLHSK